MLCPQYGNEIDDDQAQCPHCGHMTVPGARWGVASPYHVPHNDRHVGQSIKRAIERGIGRNADASEAEQDGEPSSEPPSGARWGVRTRSSSFQHADNENAALHEVSDDAIPTSAYVAASPALRKATSQGLKVFAAVAAVALVVAMGIGGFVLADSMRGEDSKTTEQAVLDEQARRHDVLLSLVAPGLDENGSLIPLHITGADAGGNAFDETAYINSDGRGLRLPAGNYGIAPAASPITANGELFLFSSNNKWFSVQRGLQDGETVDVRDEVQLVFEPADPSDLSNDALESAQQFAVEGGMDAGEVDQLLEATRAAMEEAKDGMPFGRIQDYRGATYLGDVQTNTGFVPASGVPGTQQMITRTNMFFFTNNTLYYTDNMSFSGYASQVALHSRNMTTGQESILATDVAAGTTPYYLQGNIIYTGYEWSQAIKRINLASGETSSISELVSWDFTKLVGVHNSSILLASSDGYQPQICLLPLDGGEQSTLSLGEEAGKVVGVFDDTVLVEISDWSSAKLAAYGLDGQKKWEKDVPDATTLGNRLIYRDGILCASSSSGSQLLRVNLSDGDIKKFDSGVYYLFDPLFLHDNKIYFAGSDVYATYDNYGTAASTYTSYALDSANGQIENLGSYEAPQDEDLTQQQSAYWGATDTGASWNDEPDGSVDADTTSAGAEGDGDTPTYGTDPTAGDWDQNGAYIGNGQGGYDASGNPVS